MSEHESTERDALYRYRSIPDGGEVFVKEVNPDGTGSVPTAYKVKFEDANGGVRSVEQFPPSSKWEAVAYAKGMGAGLCY